MPITFNEATDEFEGANIFGETLEGFDFSVFGGEITNSGTINGQLKANSDEGITITNTFGGVLSKASGSVYAVNLLGNGGRNFSNDGTIFGEARMGNAWDSFYNSGLIDGQLKMGKGNDQLINQIIPGIDGGPFTEGTVTGTVRMGAGDDTVVNGGILHDVRMGAGNDIYSVVTLGFGDALPPVLNDISGDIRGDSGNDTISGGDTDESFYGGSGNDILIGEGGRDKLVGGTGNDQLFGGNGNDKLSGGNGNDTIDGGNNNDDISGGGDNDLILAGSGNDKVNGNAGNDTIFGGSGNDRLSGADGDDVIEGGAGRDTMFGGDGDDVFIFRGRTEADEIRGFAEGDQIELFITTGAIVTYADVMANTEFVGNNAVINLSEVFATGGLSLGSDRGSVLTVRNVDATDLTSDAFNIIDDFITVG
ncbi:calcium-binding protein [uncultured Sulfitobacter sp.]|uniref:calcium-binding protein n=1 Tax=uncultured Sulfitobacter sp. TaxID=191468 RepID=UPI0026314E7F|nr:calcium-binding protein [uncultured Sulfitobacter sp.]